MAGTMKKTMMKVEIKDYDYFGSTLGNAYFSGLSFEQLWNCVAISTNREELDTSVSASIRLNELTKNAGDKNE